MQLKQVLVNLAIFLLIYSTITVAEVSPIGSTTNPLKVSITSYLKDGKHVVQNTKQLLDAITSEFEIYFKLSYKESYGEIIKALCTQQTQLALLSTYTYGEFRKKCRNVGEVLATKIVGGSYAYYSGIFVRRGEGINTLKDLIGKNIALGSQYSSSSFNYPLSMLIEAGINPVNDFEHIFVTGSHQASIRALVTGKAIAAGTYFKAWLKAVNNGYVDPLYFKPLAKSVQVPNGPFVIQKRLPKKLKKKLRRAFRIVHIIIGSDRFNSVGNKIDRYEVNLDEQIYLDALKSLEIVTDEIKNSILEKAKQH